MLKFIRKHFNELADDDDGIRDAARNSLMGLSRDDMELLLAVVKERMPLEPAQRAALPDIVAHVYLSGATYLRDAARGFLGVRFNTVLEAGDCLPPEGVEICGRLPGFVAFRMLQDGDLLCWIEADAANPRMALHTTEDVRARVMAHRPGDKMVFRVLRRGKMVSVAIILDAMPAQVATGVQDDFLEERNQEAARYWQEHFAPLLDNRVL